jgi:hypothetical protein
MNRAALEHILRAAAAVSDEREIVVIGSQAVPGQFPEAPDALRRVCELLGIELAVLWQWSGVTPDVIQPTQIYAALDKAVRKGTVKAVFEEER